MVPAAPNDTIALTRANVHDRRIVVGDRDDLVHAWDVIARGLAPFRPPSTLVGVTVLGYPDQLVEIDGIAALP